VVPAFWVLPPPQELEVVEVAETRRKIRRSPRVLELK
jgi:hypothetical protein